MSNMLKVPNIAFEKLDEGDERSEDGETAAASSPLLPLRENLRVLRFIAFPLYFADDVKLGVKRFFGAVIGAQERVLSIHAGFIFTPKVN